MEKVENKNDLKTFKELQNLIMQDSTKRLLCKIKILNFISL
jgi:hypothetical protein